MKRTYPFEKQNNEKDVEFIFRIKFYLLLFFFLSLTCQSKTNFPSPSFQNMLCNNVDEYSNNLK